MNLCIEHVNIDDLKPYKRNPRKHPKKQLERLGKSIDRFGYKSPIVINSDNVVLSGNARLEVAKAKGWKTIPCIRVQNMSAEDELAYVIADNQIGLLASWDDEILSQALEQLKDPVLNFDIELTGFDLADADRIIDAQKFEEPSNPRDDDFVPKRKIQSRCQTGDIWQLGSHRLICGDALDPEVITQLMADEAARMVFTDPPYNVPIKGNVSGLGKVRHDDFAMACGEMSKDGFTRFLNTSFKNMAAHSMDGSIHFICMDWRHTSELQAAAEDVFTEHKNLIVWVKDNGGMGSFYRSRHELIFCYKLGTAPHVNTFELGQHGRYRTNVWEFRGVNSRTSNRLEELAMHPTVKPVQMICEAIKDVSYRGDIVLDIFAGSGSTLIAAEKTKRIARLCELDPLYCDQILDRWDRYTKDQAECIYSCSASEKNERGE